MKMLKKFAPIKAILTLVSQPKKYSIRGLAKTAGIGVGTAKSCLDWLKAKEIVNLEIIGKTHQYSLNLNNFMTRYMKILISLNELAEAGIAKELAEKWPSILSIVLYGSVANGKDDQKSDVDLLIISRKEMILKPLNAERKISREVTFMAYTLAEWRKKAKEDKVFYERVIVEGIPLYGEMPIVS